MSKIITRLKNSDTVYITPFQETIEIHAGDFGCYSILTPTEAKQLAAELILLANEIEGNITQRKGEAK